MAHVQRVGIPGTPRLVKNRADLADNDSKKFWNVPKNLASNGEREEGGKRPNWPFDNSAIGQRPKSAPKMDDLSGTFHDKAYFRVEQRTVFFGRE